MLLGFFFIQLFERMLSLFFSVSFYERMRSTIICIINYFIVLTFVFSVVQRKSYYSTRPLIIYYYVYCSDEALIALAVEYKYSEQLDG